MTVIVFKNIKKLAQVKEPTTNLVLVLKQGLTK